MSNLLKTPVSVGTGGMLYALLKGLIGRAKDLSSFTISPFIFFIALPVIFLFPGLWSLVIYKSSKKYLGENFSCFNFILENKLLFILSEALYLIAAYCLLNFLNFKIDQYTALYMQESLLYSDLQIGTIFQINYAKSVTFIITVVGVLFLLLITLLGLLSYAAIDAKVFVIKRTFKAFFINLPGFLVLYGVLVCTIITIERSFAMFKLKAIEAIVLGQEYTDYSFIFIALRIYIVCALLNAIFVLGALAFKYLSLPIKNV